MRHEAAGITTSAFPKMIRLGGVDCSATYLHEPGDAKDGLTVTVPLFVLNQVSEARCEWLVPGMLKDKIQALLKSLPQRPRSRFVPLPESAARLTEVLGTPDAFGHGSLTDALLKQVRDVTSLDVKRTDFKLDMLSPHLFMNLQVVDEHGRQRGMGRNLGALKAELGAQGRDAGDQLAGVVLAAARVPLRRGLEDLPARLAVRQPREVRLVERIPQGQQVSLATGLLRRRPAGYFWTDRRRASAMTASSVGPSAPQFHELLSSEPSRLSSPLASLCFSL